jgi:hypothetical protein
LRGSCVCMVGWFIALISQRDYLAAISPTARADPALGRPSKEPSEGAQNRLCKSTLDSMKVHCLPEKVPCLCASPSQMASQCAQCGKDGATRARNACYTPSSTAAPVPDGALAVITHDGVSAARLGDLWWPAAQEWGGARAVVGGRSGEAYRSHLDPQAASDRGYLADQGPQLQGHRAGAAVGP